MTTCPSCKRDQVQSSAFCDHCGAVLDRPATAGVPQSVATPPVSAPDAPPKTTTVRASRPQQPYVAHDMGDIGAYMVRRLLAIAVDILVVGTLIAIAVRAWLVNAIPGQALTFGGYVELVSLTAVLLFAYRWLFEGFVGSTLGKLVFGLAVGRNGGGSIGLGRSFVRNLLLPVDLAVIGFLVAAITPQRRRLGDLVAGTVVANSRIGVLAPAIGIIVLGAAAYGANSYAGTITSAQHLAQDTSQFGPALIRGSSPAPTMAPTLAPAPTSALSPTATPSPTAGSSATPQPSPSPSPPEESPTPTGSPSPV